MERIDFTKVKTLFQKYKFVLLILILGIVLMSLPEEYDPPSPSQPAVPEASQATVSQQLEEILGQISGVGRVRVLLTESAGAETVYQTNEDQTSSADSQSIRKEIVLVTDSSREEHGLIRYVTPPVYLGAVIVCQGGDTPSVRLSVVEAVSKVTGLGSDRITVLKMK